MLLLCSATACAHALPPPRVLDVPPRPTPWALDVTPLGTSVPDLDLAVGRSIAANPRVVRVEPPASFDGHVDLTVSATGTPLADEFCRAEVRVVVRRSFGPTILNDTQSLSERCGWDANARTLLYDQAVAWALERAVQALAQPE